MASLKVVSTNDNSLLIVDRLDPIRSVWQSVASGAGQLDYFGNTQGACFLSSTIAASGPDSSQSTRIGS